MSSKNYDFGTVVEFGALTTEYSANEIALGNVCNQIAIVNETDGRILIQRDGVAVDSLAAGKSRSYVNWATFETISIKYTGTQPTEGFVSVQACYADYFG